ncbi:hemin uptake protein HemP [Gemmobacter sp.]|uniref:hemin uptake protein HemP n=1 Tax=Gemmobacter sp. TaxID=1898957 RepID=UPI002AFF1487|nr:hemin uptake protein HemP [Gemmobacter sp.]
MSWHDRTIPASTTVAPAAVLPVHSAMQLTKGGNLAHIVLEGQTYTLRITRAGKLILTK